MILVQEVRRAVNCSSMDVGGLRLAMYGLESSLKDEEEPPQPGLPYFPEGIFFLSYAQVNLEVNFFFWSRKSKNNNKYNIICKKKFFGTLQT